MPSPSIKRRLPEKLIDVNDLGNTIKISIPRTRWIEKINLNVILGSITGGGAFNADALDRLVRNVRLIGNGDIVIKNYNWFDYHDLMKILYRNTEIPAGFLVVNFVIPELPPEEGKNFLLPAHLFTSLEFELDLDTVANVTTDTVTAIGATKIQVTLKEWKREVVDPVLTNPLINKEVEIVHKVDTTDEEIEFELNRGNEYKKIAILVHDQASTPVRSNTLLTRFEFKEDDINTILNDFFTSSQDEDVIEYGLTTAPPTGITIADFSDINSVENLYDSEGVDKFAVLYVVSAVATIKLITQEIMTL